MKKFRKLELETEIKNEKSMSQKILKMVCLAMNKISALTLKQKKKVGMYKKYKNIIILCIMVIVELIGLIVYFSLHDKEINMGLDGLRNILEIINSFKKEFIEHYLPEFLWKTLPTIITLFGISIFNGVKNFIKIKRNWKNRSAIKYTLICANENVDLKEFLLNDVRFVIEILGFIVSFGVCIGIANIIVVFFNTNVVIKFGIILATVFIIGILRSNTKVNRNKLFALVLYGIIGSLSVLFISELYTEDPNIIVRFACASTFTITLMGYYIIYHFLLLSNVKSLPTYIFIITRVILLIGLITGIFIVQSVCVELYNLWLILLIAENIGQLWIGKKDLSEIIIRTKSGHAIKVKKNIIQYENEKIGYIDQEGKEVLCENKIIDYIYYQNKVSLRYEKRVKRKSREVICFVDGKKKPFIGQKYHVKSDWILMKYVDNRIVTQIFIPMNMVKKIIEY